MGYPALRTVWSRFQAAIGAKNNALTAYNPMRMCSNQMRLSTGKTKRSQKMS
jgi:hypothetical protein